MDEIHSICVQNGIRYTLIGGSLIGALRHKGFIPWDDDMDIGMPYADYERFEKIVSNLNHEWVKFSSAQNDLNCFNPFIKAHDTRTTLIEGFESEANGVFIDIFPFSYAGDTKKQALREFQKHRILQAFLRRKRYRFKTGKFKEFLLNSIAKFFSKETLIKKINAQYINLNQNKSNFISDMDGKENGIVSSCFFDNFSSILFEGHSYSIIKDADSYLKAVFGNYMQMPPKEKQVPSHIEFLDLNTPAKNYANKV
jgi:lipopolysaccharide cholinephosphotransferase